MEFLTWEMLAAESGCAAAVAALTQVIKQYINVDPKWIALALSLVITFALQFIVYLDASAKSDFTAANIILAALNSFAVTGVAIGLFEGVKYVGKGINGKGRCR